MGQRGEAGGCEWVAREGREFIPFSKKEVGREEGDGRWEMGDGGKGGLGFGVWSLEFEVWSLEFEVWLLEERTEERRRIYLIYVKKDSSTCEVV
jgi:hypothetical protein